jgi:hypothetical protein
MPSAREVSQTRYMDTNETPQRIIFPTLLSWYQYGEHHPKHFYYWGKRLPLTLSQKQTNIKLLRLWLFLGRPDPRAMLADLRAKNPVTLSHFHQMSCEELTLE